MSRRSQLVTFVKAGSPVFDRFQGSIAANQWLRIVWDTLNLLGTLVKYYVLFATHILSGVTHTWWENLRFSYNTHTMTWDMFDRLFTDNYFNPDYQQALVDEFERLKQGSMTVIDYYNYFTELA